MFFPPANYKHFPVERIVDYLWTFFLHRKIKPTIYSLLTRYEICYDLSFISRRTQLLKQLWVNEIIHHLQAKEKRETWFCPSYIHKKQPNSRIWGLNCQFHIFFQIIILPGNNCHMRRKININFRKKIECDFTLERDFLHWAFLNSITKKERN